MPIKVDEVLAYLLIKHCILKYKMSKFSTHTIIFTYIINFFMLFNEQNFHILQYAFAACILLYDLSPTALLI